MSRGLEGDVVVSDARDDLYQKKTRLEDLWCPQRSFITGNITHIKYSCHNNDFAKEIGPRKYSNLPWLDFSWVFSVLTYHIISKYFAIKIYYAGFVYINKYNIL